MAVEIRKNKERGGIEISFPSKPADEVLAWLKSKGFGWSKYNKVWWMKFNENVWIAVHDYFDIPLPEASIAGNPELPIGIAIEKEHTDNPMIAEKIATDHLKENPNYYSEPKPANWAEKELEKEAKKEGIKSFEQYLNDAREYGWKNNEAIHEMYKIYLLQNAYEDEINADNFGTGIRKNIEDARQGIAINLMKVKIVDESSFVYGKKKVAELMDRARAEGKAIKSTENNKAMAKEFWKMTKAEYRKHWVKMYENWNPETEVTKGVSKKWYARRPDGSTTTAWTTKKLAISRIKDEKISLIAMIKNGSLDWEHKAHIENAIKENKVIPEKVIIDYPELRAIKPKKEFFTETAIYTPPAHREAEIEREQASQDKKNKFEQLASLQISDIKDKTIPELDNLIEQLESGMKDILDQEDTERAKKLNELIGRIIDARNEIKDLQETKNAQNAIRKVIENLSSVGSIRPGFMTDYKTFPMLKGREIQISMPNGEKRNGIFAIVELDNIVASHNEENFHSDPIYPKNASGNNINDRNYSGDLAAQKAVMDYARELEPERLITTSRTPSGTPIITKDGFVVSGNNRTMSLKLAAKQYPDNYKEYVKFLTEEIDSYGFKNYVGTALILHDSIAIEGSSYNEPKNVTFTHPVLVRIDLDFPEYTTQELAKYNKDTKKAERPIDKAIKLSNILRDNSRCADIIAATVGEYETFSEFYVNIAGQKRLAKTLVECNLLTEQELPAFFSDTTFTEAGKEFVESLLAALILDREALMATEQPGVKVTRQKLITALPVLMKNASLPEGSLKHKINDAVILQYNMKGSTFADFIRQRTMFGTIYDRQTVYLNRLIDSGKIRFKRAIEGYNDAIMANQGASLFGEKPSNDEIFNHWIVGDVSETDKKLIESSDVVSKGEVFGTFAGQVPVESMQKAWKENIPIKEVFEAAGKDYIPTKPEAKYKVGDIVRYKQGDVDIEHWYGIIKEVREMGAEYLYRIDGYALNNAGNVMFDSEKTNEKYESQLTLLGTTSLYASLKKEYEFHKVFLREEEGLKIYTINGEAVRRDHIEFVSGGHGYVYDYIPKDEVWIDDNQKDKPNDMEATIKHELFEVKKMRDEGMSYDDAHELANAMEKEVRNDEPILTTGNAYADYVINEIGHKFTERFPDKTFERESIINRWIKVKDWSESGTAKANTEIEELFTSYLPLHLWPESRQILKTGFEKSQRLFKEESPKTRTDPHFKEAFDSYKPKVKTKDDTAEERLQKLMLLRKFISVSQHEALSELMMGEEGEAGWEIIDKLGAIIQTMPHTYQTEKTKTDDKIVYLHYFKGGSDWYIVEKDKLPVQQQAFGYAILNGDDINAEWGYVNIVELIQSNVELDFYWTPKPFKEVKKKWQEEELTGEKAGERRAGEDEPEPKQTTVAHTKEGDTEPTVSTFSLVWSDYANEFQLNKGIERLIDAKGNDKDWSAEELEFIKGYTGYGGLDKEAEKAGEKVDVKSLYEFYTPEPVIEKMWGLAYKYGYNEGPLVEPSAGIGIFLSRRYVKSSVIKTAYEINKYSAKIIKLLYPETNVNDGAESKYFEQVFIKNNYTVRGNISPVHELVIGNPPYGAAESLYLGMGEKTYSHAKNYIDYFIFRGLDLLKKDGLLIYIIGAEVAAGGKPWLDQGDSKCKQLIAAKGKLIDAYRLPEGLFPRTNVVCDIIVVKKR